MLSTPTKEIPTFLEKRLPKILPEEPLSQFPDFVRALSDFSPYAERLFYASMMEAVAHKKYHVVSYMSEFWPNFTLMTDADNIEEYVATLGHKEASPYIAPYTTIHMGDDWSVFPIAFAARGTKNPRLDIYRLQQKEDTSIERLAGISLQKKKQATNRRWVKNEGVYLSLLNFENGPEEIATPIIFDGGVALFERLHASVDQLRQNLRDDFALPRVSFIPEPVYALPQE